MNAQASVKNKPRDGEEKKIKVPAIRKGMIAINIPKIQLPVTKTYVRETHKIITTNKAPRFCILAY